MTKPNPKKSGGNHGGKMPSFEPTEEQRSIVKLMAGFGIPQNRICWAIINKRTAKPISLETLEKAFRDELDQGMAEVDQIVAKSLLKQIEAGNTGVLVWFTKNRWGWKDSSRNEITGADGKPLVTGLEVSFVMPPKHSDDTI